MPAAFVELDERPVPQLDGVGAAGDLDDRHLADHLAPLVGGEVPGEAVGVDGRRGDDDLEVGASRQQLLEVPEDEVDVEAALVGLVDDDRVVAAQVTVALHLAEQDAVGHHLDAGVVAALVGEAHLVADQVAERHLHLLGEALGHRPRGDPPGLGVPDLPGAAEPELEAHLRQLGGLAGARLAGDDDHLVLAQGGEDVVAALDHREVLGVVQPGGVDRCRALPLAGRGRRRGAGPGAGPSPRRRPPRRRRPRGSGLGGHARQDRSARAARSTAIAARPGPCRGRRLAQRSRPRRSSTCLPASGGRLQRRAGGVHRPGAVGGGEPPVVEEPGVDPRRRDPGPRRRRASSHPGQRRRPARPRRRPARRGARWACPGHPARRRCAAPPRRGGGPPPPLRRRPARAPTAGRAPPRRRCPAGPRSPTRRPALGRGRPCR